MRREERLKIVNIGAGDLKEGNLKLALGLIWTLILRYQIGGVKAKRSRSRPTSGEISPRTITESSAKQILLDWCSETIKAQPPLNNFTSNFQDGVAFAKLFNSIDPNCVDESLLSDDKVKNLDYVFEQAYKTLAIPKLLVAQEIVEDQPDALSMMTYVALIRQKALETRRAPATPSKSASV